jgi:UPF0271 protein
VPIDCLKGNVVLDAAGLFAGVELGHGVFYVTEGVLREVLDRESRMKLELARTSGKIIVATPPREHVVMVISKSRELGVLEELSEADIEILALASYVRSVCGSSIIYTDDKLVQDVATSLGIKVQGVKYLERSRPRRYIYRCRVCGFTSRNPGDCPRCGTPLELEASR